MNTKSGNKQNRPPEYETKFKFIILDYLKKNRSVNIADLEKKIKDEYGISISRQTLRYNLRALGKSGEINFYIMLNPTTKGFKLPEDEEIFITLPIPSDIDGHPKLVLKLIDQLSSSSNEIVNKNSAEIIQLFIKRVKTNLSIDAHLYEEKIQQYKKHLKDEQKYKNKEIEKHLKIYVSKNKKETCETALQNAEIEAKKLIDFLIHDATEEFKIKVANQLSIPNKDGKYDLIFEYKIYKN